MVFYGQHQEQACCEGAAGEVRCGHVSFFADSAAAQAWSQAHPQAAGRLLAQRQAWEMGVDIFGPLMRP